MLTLGWGFQLHRLWRRPWLFVEMSNFPKIRARHGTGTAHLLDRPSIKSSIHLGPASSPAVYPFSIRLLMLSPADITL